MNRFKSLKQMQHFYCTELKKKKGKTISVDNYSKHMQHCIKFWKDSKQNLLDIEVNTFPQIKHVHSFESHLLKNKLKFLMMSCSFKTNPASLPTHPENWYISCLVYSDTSTSKHAGCCHNDWPDSFMAGHLIVSMMNMSWL